MFLYIISRIHGRPQGGGGASVGRRHPWKIKKIKKKDKKKRRKLLKSLNEKNV